MVCLKCIDAGDTETQTQKNTYTNTQAHTRHTLVLHAPYASDEDEEPTDRDRTETPARAAGQLGVALLI